jgi:polyisoprenoid-binding protein YceI
MNTTQRFFTFGLIQGFAAIALAASFGVARGAWAETQVKLGVQLQPVGSFVAESSNIKGEAMKRGDMWAAKNVTLALDDLKTGISLRDKHMKEKYLETEKYPTATLKAAKGKGGRFVGILAVHGVEQKINGTYEISGSELTTKFKTKASGYHISKASYMGVGVVDDVDVTVTIPVKGE